MTPPFLCINSTEIFDRIFDTSISSYLLDQNILSHPRHLHFNVSTRPEYSLASSTTQFLRIYSTKVFFRILDTSISSYQLDQSILLHPRHLHFFISTRPKHSSIASTSTRYLLYLLDQNILSHPLHLHFFVST